VYNCCEGLNSKYEGLAGKYFKVLEVIKHPKADESKYLYGKNFFLKLQEKVKNDVVYFEYDGEFEFNFPFIVVGFFEKQKKLLIGKEFVFADKILEGKIDMQTGLNITFKTGEKWKCTDFTIEEQYYSLSLVT
jgi:hypothetical protein